MSVTVTGKVAHKCPHVDEYDIGDIVITWPGDNAPELHGVRTYLDAFATLRITHEEMTQRCANDLGCAVDTTWRTAGFDVRVSAVPKAEG